MFLPFKQNKFRNDFTLEKNPKKQTKQTYIRINLDV